MAGQARHSAGALPQSFELALLQITPRRDSANSKMSSGSFWPSAQLTGLQLLYIELRKELFGIEDLQGSPGKILLKDTSP